MMEMHDKPPFFKNWSGWYIAVLVILVVQIIFFQLITKYFS